MLRHRSSHLEDRRTAVNVVFCSLVADAVGRQETRGPRARDDRRGRADDQRDDRRRQHLWHAEAHRQVVDQILRSPDAIRLGGNRPREVVGVVKDFKQQSLREEIVPIVIFPNKRWYATAGIVMNSNNLLRSRQEIQAIWDRMFPEYVYNASFLDENINRYYEQEERLSRLYKVYALLAIFISCLGLYGLVSFMVVRKTREVGIRKVLGAGVGDILFLFSREFTLLIIIAFVLAAPAAWYFMNGWLSDFAYRIRVGIGVFAAAILLSLVVAWLTVGYKSLKAATANPVKSLRTE